MSHFQRPKIAWFRYRYFCGCSFYALALRHANTEIHMDKTYTPGKHKYHVYKQGRCLQEHTELSG